jgi:hypothetical protein
MPYKATPHQQQPAGTNRAGPSDPLNATAHNRNAHPNSSIRHSLHAMMLGLEQCRLLYAGPTTGAASGIAAAAVEQGRVDRGEER